MVPLPTIDPTIVIVGLGGTPAPWVRYRRVATGEEWTVRGVCNQCGVCVVGAANDDYTWVGPPGTPYSNIDNRVALGRLDAPIVPGFLAQMRRMAKEIPTATVTGCSLTIDEEP